MVRHVEHMRFVAPHFQMILEKLINLPSTGEERMCDRMVAFSLFVT